MHNDDSDEHACLRDQANTRNTRLTCWQAICSRGLLCGALGFFTVFALLGLFSVGGFRFLVSRLSLPAATCHAAHVLLIVILVLLATGKQKTADV